MVDAIRKAITVYVPGNLCNLRCGYCYVSECLKTEHEKRAEFSYSIEHMIKAFRPERIGGIAYITVIGAGETLIPPEVVPFVRGLLHYGHVVEVVTNNTLNNRIEELLMTPENELKRLIVKCSLHWNELKRLNKIDDFFNNMKKVIAAGASSYPFMVMCEDYMQELDEIIKTCEKEIGALPQCTPCVTANNREDFLEGGTAVTMPVCTTEFVKKIDSKLHSKLFLECVRFLDVDPQKIFCYAGKWAFGVEMSTGTYLKCHNVVTEYNFFEDINQPIECSAVGCECGIASCSLQYPLFGLGMIPEVENVPTYSEMICDREGLFQEEVIKLLDNKISNLEHIYTEEEKILFLMEQIHEKNKIIDGEMQLINKQREMLVNYGNNEVQERKMVEVVLSRIDSEKTNFEDLGDITYEHLKALLKICRGMENGEIIFKKMLMKIYNGLLNTHVYLMPEIVYNEETREVSQGILKMPVTVIVAENKNCEIIKKCLEIKDDVKLANVIYKQIQYL